MSFSKSPCIMKNKLKLAFDSKIEAMPAHATIGAEMPSNDFSIAPQNLGSFNYFGRTYFIWESTRNVAISATLWQFRYSPMLLPELSSTGDLSIRQIQMPHGLRIIFRIRLFDDDMARIAFEEVQRRYPNQAKDIQASNITVLPVRTIRFSLIDLAVQVPGAKLIENVDLFLIDNRIDISIDVPDENSVGALKKYLSAATLNYAVSFDAKTTRQNSVTIKYKDLKESNLFVQLDGRGTSDVYIHRDDLRNLTDGINRTITTVGVIEDPEKFNDDIFTKILTTLTQGLSSSNFDEQKWRSTYNADDLKPDIISKTLNKMFTKDEAENTWKYHADAEFEGKANLVKILEAESKIKGSYSNEGMKRALAERNIEVQFEGNKIVAKSINLRQININQFNSDANFTSIVTYVEDSGQAHNGSVNLAGLHQGQNTPDIYARVAILERLVPVGTVISFVGLAQKIPEIDGWLSCDGRSLSRTGQYSELFSIISTLHGAGDGKNTFNIPDFRGFFLRGVTGTSSVDSGISKRIPIAGNQANEAGSLQYAGTARPGQPFQTTGVPDHYHGDPTWNGGAGPYEVATLHRGPGGVDYGAQSALTTGSGGHSHEISGGGDEETRPINKYVHWLIKAS